MGILAVRDADRLLAELLVDLVDQARSKAIRRE
jgi:hypothetical protein